MERETPLPSQAAIHAATRLLPLSHVDGHLSWNINNLLAPSLNTRLKASCSGMKKIFIAGRTSKVSRFERKGGFAIPGYSSPGS